jgi:hypothetical protein
MTKHCAETPFAAVQVIIVLPVDSALIVPLLIEATDALLLDQKKVVL